MSFNTLNKLVRLGREFGHETIRRAGFSDTEHAICAFLYFHDMVSQDTISNALLLDKTTVAKALRVMEREGLIYKSQNEKNRRENVIRLTETGKACIAGNIHLYENWLKEVCSCLTQEELRTFNSYLDRLFENALKLNNDSGINKNREE